MSYDEALNMTLRMKYVPIGTRDLGPVELGTRRIYSPRIPPLYIEVGYLAPKIIKPKIPALRIIMAKTNEPTDQTDPHPGQRVDIVDLPLRKFSAASDTSTTSSERSFEASTRDPATSRDAPSKDDILRKVRSYKQQGIEVRDFARRKSSRKSKSDVEASRRLLEKSTLF
jgi:hypothetical protein